MMQDQDRDYHHVGPTIEFQASIRGKACKKYDEGSILRP